MENVLYMWFMQERSKTLLGISGEILKAKAIEFEKMVEFRASIIWLDKIK